MDKTQYYLTQIVDNTNSSMNNAKELSVLNIHSQFDVGLGCERIDQGRSYVDQNITISKCLFVTVSSCSMKVSYSIFYLVMIYKKDLRN